MSQVMLEVWRLFLIFNAHILIDMKACLIVQIDLFNKWHFVKNCVGSCTGLTCLLQSPSSLRTGPHFCQALISQKHHHWCRISSVRPVFGLTFTAEMSTCEGSSLGTSTTVYMWRWQWQHSSHLVLGQARPTAIQWPPRYSSTRERPVTRLSVLFPQPATTSAIKSSRLSPHSGNMISSVSATRQCAMN